MAKKTARKTYKTRSVSQSRSTQSRSTRKQTKQSTRSAPTKQKPSRNPMVILAFIVFGVLLGLWVVNWGGGLKRQATAEPLSVSEVFNCNQDSDCTVVPAGCCGCSAGGRNIAINKKYEQYWRNRWLQRCSETVCTTVISQDESCSGQVKCLDSLCQIQ